MRGGKVLNDYPESLLEGNNQAAESGGRGGSSRSAGCSLSAGCRSRPPDSEVPVGEFALSGFGVDGREPFRPPHYLSKSPEFQLLVHLSNQHAFRLTPDAELRTNRRWSFCVFFSPKHPLQKGVWRIPGQNQPSQYAQ